ncbi:hypothetical protein [Leeuwenhoekiella sp. MAR_2009_132]|uniref:hypothetical protein n=1 Tax=Leeuwenhoekiella sp. MAR_2009_132 TaxID=1392489 RepID=UPI000AAB542B|nr:hypothetical protein [Leeuwenhoekiella sp. MAR_2009_132]
MKKKAQLERDIIDITMTIHDKFPELSKYITEIPEKESGIHSEQMSVKNFKEYYNSLQEVLLEYAKTHQTQKEKENSKAMKFRGYPTYPSSEDIYNKAQEEKDLDPENPLKKKTSNTVKGTFNEKEFQNDKSGDDLDVPGSELDDQQERLGSEDEENNYYSIGGDNHNNLEEDLG